MENTKPVPIVALWLNGLETLRYLDPDEMQRILNCAERLLQIIDGQIEAPTMGKLRNRE